MLDWIKMNKMYTIISLKSLQLHNSNLNKVLLSIQLYKHSINTSDRRLGRYLKKSAEIISGKTKKKKKVFHEFYSESPFQADLSSTSYKNVKTSSAKFDTARVKQLSVVFQDHVTSLMFSGEVCPELNELGFEISKVRVSPDFKFLNIDWLASGNDMEKDIKIEELLPLCASELRSALNNMRVIGYVPHVQFCKDLSLSKFQEVEHLLSIADMGTEYNEEDSIENDSFEVLDNQDTNEFKSFSNDKKRNKTLNSINSKWDKSEVLKNDIYGVDYDEIRSEILREKKKCKKTEFNKSGLTIDTEVKTVL